MRTARTATPRIIALAARGRQALGVAALCAALAAGAQPSQPSQPDPRQLEDLRARILAVQEALDRDREQRDELRVQLEAVERRTADLSADLAGLAERITAQNAQLRTTRAERAAAEQGLARHRTTLARQVRAAYLIGQRGRTKLLLNQDRTAQLSRVMTYYDYLNRARAARIGSILEQTRALEAIEARLKQDTDALEFTRGQHQGTLAALEATRAERGGMLKALAERIAGGEGELKALRASERELSRLIEQLQRALADIPADLGSKPMAQLKGRLPWPLKGKVLAGYGEPKGGGPLKWNGLWIEGREGDPVQAVARGRVAYVGWMHRYGLITVLEHEGGYYSLYGHAQNVPVSIGDWVNAGDAVATAGSTGGHDRPGVYFELRKGTDAINPRPWLRGAAAGKKKKKAAKR